MTQSLSAEEIARIHNLHEHCIDGPAGECIGTAQEVLDRIPALLAMASRLVELESALSFVSQFPGEIRCAAPLEPSLLPAFAAGLGWPGPTSQAKGG